MPQKPKLAFFPPWFLTEKLVLKIDALLPYYYHKRLRFYFDQHGCIRCRRKDVDYCAGGLCKPCNGLISDRLKRTDRTMKQRYDTDAQAPCESFLRKRNSARALLADFRHR